MVDAVVHGQRPLPGGLSDQLVAMVRRLPPPGARVVPGSTPVVAFGDPRNAEAATLGINPSHREFADNGVLLSGGDRRLATLQSLGANRLDRLTDRQVAEVVNDCAAYFQRRPYRRWFDPLDDLLYASTGCSYYDGTACHLDLVQWASDPAWGQISDSDVRKMLLDDGVPHLRAQLAHDNVRLVLLNGRQVLDQVQAVGLATLDESGTIPLGQRSCRLYVGEGSGVHWVGWSANLQSSFGVSNAFKQRLAASIGELCAPQAAATDALATPDSPGHLPRGTRVGGKTELVDLLASGLRDSQAPTIGDVGSFGGCPWLIIDVAGREVALNADTKRTAVETFLRGAKANPEQPWRVVANRRGRINKVLPHPEPEALPGWYAYLTDPLAAEGTI
jgi:hypothetical protein